MARRGFGAIVLFAAAAAPSGCSATTAIRPGDLPVVTSAATRQGRLDAVVVTRRDQREDRYAASVSARIDGASIVVESHGQERRYAPWDIQSVAVQRYNTTGAVLAGTGLTVLGVVAIVLGAVVGRRLHATGGDPLLAVTLGFPLVTGGVGLAAGGVPLIIAGASNP